jgi:hypothetical protein
MIGHEFPLKPVPSSLATEGEMQRVTRPVTTSPRSRTIFQELNHIIESDRFPSSSRQFPTTPLPATSPLGREPESR